MQVKDKVIEVLKLLRKYIVVILFCVNLIVISLFYFSSQAWTSQPSFHPNIATLGLLFPFVVLANVIFLLLWVILRKWKPLLVQVVAFIWFWNPISTIFPIHFPTNDIPEDCVKLLSYNVRAFNWLEGQKGRYNPMFDYILSQEADIICFQEYVISTNNRKKGIITEKEFNTIMKDYPYHSIVRLGFGAGYTKYVYGLACYSKYPIESTEKINFGQETHNGAAIFNIKKDGHSLAVYNCHLETNRITAEDKKLYNQFFERKDTDTFNKLTHKLHNRLGVAFKLRESQAKTIKESIALNESDALIVCGDFNDTPISYTYNTIKGDLTDAYANTGFGYGNTYHENKFWVRIDHIMHSSSIESYNARIGSQKFSDHYPISAYLKLNFK